tara:strand:- start:454 stop:1374 length:921 start_codon:yes stop_codon:yes gene_type:complete
MKIGIIGNGNHSKRIQKILKKKKLSFFIYKPKKPKYFEKEDFENIKKCKIIFILSPNKTHFHYIKSLYKNCYIFCEKPPVTNKNDLKLLSRINNGKIYFNFNKRFSNLSTIIQKKSKYKLGKIIYGSLITSHGLAQKKGYLTNWRSNKSKSKKGVFEMVSIHDVDLINYIFDISRINNLNLSNTSKKGSSMDTASCQLTLKSGSIINVFSTYNSSYNETIYLLFENGMIIKNEKKIVVRGPTKTFNKKGMFIKPPVIFEKNILAENDYKDSLEKSVNYFLKHSKKNTKFKKKDFMSSIKSNKIMLS